MKQHSNEILEINNKMKVITLLLTTLLLVQGNDWCPENNNGICDEPYRCPPGSDSTDCKEYVDQDNQYCPYTMDGICQEVSSITYDRFDNVIWMIIPYCRAGSDTYDCCVGNTTKEKDKKGELSSKNICCGIGCGEVWNEDILHNWETVHERLVNDLILDFRIDDSCPTAKDGHCDYNYKRKNENHCHPGSDNTDCSVARLAGREGWRKLPQGWVEDYRENTGSNESEGWGKLVKEYHWKDRREGPVQVPTATPMAVDEQTLEQTKKNEEHESIPECSGVLHCGVINSNEVNSYNKSNEVHISEFFGSVIFQGLLVYCSCIYYKRIMDGFYFIEDNFDIIINLFICIVKCFAYIIILFMTIIIILGAITNEDKEIDVLKVMFIISFLDFLDRRNEGGDEDEEYLRWRRRRNV